MLLSTALFVSPSRVRGCTLGLLLVFACYGSPTQEANRKGDVRATIEEVHVRLLVLHKFGEEISSATIEFKPLAGTDVSRRVFYPKEVVIALKKTKYIVDVSSYGMLPYSSVVEFSSRQNVLVIGLTLSPISTPLDGSIGFPKLSGYVSKQFLLRAPYWIRIVDLYSGLTETAEVFSDGTFEISNAPSGRYMLFVMNRGTLVETRTIELRFPSTHIVIEGIKQPGR